MERMPVIIPNLRYIKNAKQLLYRLTHYHSVNFIYFYYFCHLLRTE